MNNIKNLGVSALVAGLVAAFLGAYVIEGQPGRDGRDGQTLSGVSPVLNSPFFRFGDVDVYSARTEALNTASTTICSIQSPAATSTLVSASVDISVSTSSSYILTLSKANTIAASTTPLIESASIASAAKATLTASSTSSGGGVWGPNTFLNATVRGGSGGVSYGFTMGKGSCHAKWEQVSYTSSI